MLPIKITISGFCSYMDETTIDFTELGTNGIYLITGDTGAGKTTIFDAIKYALYGKSSNDNRETNMLRNNKATPTTPTFVNFDFQKGGQLYNIKRNPSYERLATRGSGTATQSASVSLTLPDGTIESSSKEVTTKIYEILGVDENQFSQISMIAQGEFQKLLTCSTKERSEIFRQIFKTEKYEQLQSSLKYKTQYLVNENQNIRNELDEDFKSINLWPHESIDVNLSYANKITEIQNILSNDKKQLKINNTNLATENQNLIKISNDLTLINNQVKIYEDLKKATTKKISLEEQLTTLDGILKAEQAKEEERKSVNESIQNVKNSLPKYEELDKLNTILNKAKKDKSKNEIELENENNNLSTKTNSLNSQKQQHESLKDTSKNLETAKNTLKILQDKDTMFSECKDLIQKFKLLDVEKEQTQLTVLNKKFKTVSEKYNTIFTTFFASQAGILAKDLKDNDLCLVCGSTNHPKKASLPQNAPTQQDLNAAKDKLEDIKDKVSTQSNKITKLLEQQSNAKDNICNSANKILSTTYDNSVEISNIEDALTLEYSNLTSDLTKTNTDVKTLNSNLTIFNNLSTQIPIEEENIKTISNGINVIESNILVNTKDIEHNQQSIDKIGKLDFADLNQANDKLISLQEQLKALNYALEKAQTEYNNHTIAVSTVNGEITSYKGQLKGVESLQDLETSVESKLDEYSDTKAKISNLQKNNETYSNKILNNNFHLNNMNKNINLLDINDKKSANVLKLSECANGRITIETFVQQTFFDNIVARANLRFYEMSNGAYHLIRQKSSSGNAKAGLDLDILDMADYTVRSVKSLSGGESFMASISLALGLSDEVQSNAGGIELDALFIDEGFGSLDTETLNTAINVLQKLSQNGKTIGMISHVEKLKDRIDKQIVVKKSINSKGIEVSNVNLVY